MDESEYLLMQWKSNELLKAACRHLREQPEYVAMDAAQRSEMVQFTHALRRKLMQVLADVDSTGNGLRLRGCVDLYGMDVSTADHLRYTVTVHGYTFVLIMGVPVAPGT